MQVTRDITELETERHKAQEYANDLDNIFSNAPFSISYLDKELRIRRINSAMEKLVGARSHEVKGRYCYDVWGQHANDDSRSGKGKICDECLAIKALEDGKTYTFEREVGGRFIEVTSSPVKDKNHKVIGVMEIGHDITARKQAEKQLEAYAEYNHTLNKLHAAILKLMPPENSDKDTEIWVKAFAKEGVEHYDSYNMEKD